MTDKEFVQTTYPDAVMRTKDFFGLNKLGTDENIYAIFRGDRKKAKRNHAITMFWTKTEDDAWKQAAAYLRQQFLKKLES